MDLLWQQICCCFHCGISSAICSVTNKGVMLLNKHRKQALAVFYFALEGVSFGLDQFEKRRWGFLLLAFLLATFVSTAVTYAHIKDRNSVAIMSEAERQLGAIEVLFSVLQLIPTFIDFLVGVLGINIEYTIPCVFPLVFAMVAVAFVFRKDKNVIDSVPYLEDDVLSPEHIPTDLPESDSTHVEVDRTETTMVTAIPTISASTSISSPIEVDLPVGTSIDENETQLRYRFQSKNEQLQVDSEREFMFEMSLTPSDVGKLNRLLIPNELAKKFLPLGSYLAEKGVLLDVEDESGKHWSFRYSYWNSSDSYVFTKSWSRYVKDKKAEAGDVIRLGRHQTERERLFIELRRQRDKPEFQDNESRSRSHERQLSIDIMKVG